MWEELEQWTGNRRFIFHLPLSHTSRSFCAQCLPRSAYKAPVMQATQVITHQALNSNNRCMDTARSPLDQNLILLLKAMIKYILML